MGVVYGKYVEGSPMGVSFSKKVKFTFPNSLTKQPLIYKMSENYKVVTNIERTDINETERCVIIEINGTGDEMDKALQWIENKGVLVQMMLPNLYIN